MNAEQMVEQYIAKKVRVRDEELRRRLLREKSTEEMISSFALLKGLNVEERIRAREKREAQEVAV